MSIKEKLVEALAKKENDINLFVWKGKKSEINGQLMQDEVKMVDCSVKELQGFYRHCESMLYNDNKDNPGRYLLLEIITDQRDRCNTEMFLKWLSKEKNTSKYAFLTSLQEFLNNNPQINPDEAPISVAVGGCPKEYTNLSIAMVLSGCLDTLGYFSKKHITLTFLLKQGLWFTSEESKKMAKENVTDKLEYARKYLGLKSTNNLRIDPKGLSLAQMYSMVTLKSKKYSELTDIQLETLRNRILFSLENEVRFHIQQWENRERQIKLVLQSKGVEI